MKRSLSHGGKASPSPPSSPGIKRSHHSSPKEYKPSFFTRSFLSLIGENAHKPVEERESLNHYASMVIKWVLHTLEYSKLFGDIEALSWLKSFDLLSLWFSALLALKVENQHIPSYATNSILLETASHARNVTPNLPNCCSLSLMLVNLMLSREDGTELDNLIGTVQSFQSTCSPINLLINFMLARTIYPGSNAIFSDTPSLDGQLPFIRILSGSRNAVSAILSVISRLANHAVTPFSLNSVSLDGSYPLHQAMAACLSGYIPVSFVISLIRLGAYPYAYSQNQLCTPFELTHDMLDAHVDIGFHYRLQDIKFECTRLGLISDVLPLKTLAARCAARYQPKNIAIPHSVTEFVKWHEYDQFNLNKHCDQETTLQMLQTYLERNNNRRPPSSLMYLQYDPPFDCDVHSFFANAYHTPGSVLEILLKQPWINS